MPAMYLSDNWFRVLDVKNGKTGVAISDATVRLLALLRNGEAVGGLTVPLTIPNYASGAYEVLLPRTVELQRGVSYLAKVEIDGGAGLYRYMEGLVSVTV